jgi:hypothetical protein
MNLWAMRRLSPSSFLCSKLPWSRPSCHRDVLFRRTMNRLPRGDTCHHTFQFHPDLYSTRYFRMSLRGSLHQHLRHCPQGQQRIQPSPCPRPRRDSRSISSSHRPWVGDANPHPLLSHHHHHQNWEVNWKAHRCKLLRGSYRHGSLRKTLGGPLLRSRRPW